MIEAVDESALLSEEILPNVVGNIPASCLPTV